MISRNGVVGIMTKLDGPVLESRQVQGIFFSSVNHQNRLLHPHNGYGGFFFKESCQVVKLTIQTHLLPGLRTSGAINLLPLYVFVVWRGAYYLANKVKEVM